MDGALSSLFHYLNGAKELRRIDLVEPGAREAAERLCRWANLMLESKGAGAAERLGLGEGLPEELNPRLVRVSISPFGALGASDPVVVMVNYFSWATRSGRERRA
jgi:crotonobetainyl-CoA:carnitine CoA-transferase CaiB-like acyl-CoA transferase